MSGPELLIMTQIVNALMLLPFVLFFIPAGEINDKRSKLKNMKTLALAAIILCVILTMFYAAGFFWASFFATLALGTQAAFYSPAKFGFAKELSKDETGLAKINSALQNISIVVDTAIDSRFFQ
jgi:acyl-[acyl-carrier-protein]-phospholipid O-acyltransferase/long-chain-fatty-acid--[acyl-carrier-protein] ligase